MAKIFLATLGALALTTTLGAQPPTPATQPVRPPDRPPTGQPTSPLPAPEPNLGGDRNRRLGRDADSSSGEKSGPDAGVLTLQGCLQRVSARAYRLQPVAGNEATVTEAVSLGGAMGPLRQHVGSLVEVRGSYEQATPAGTTPATFSVDRVKKLPGTCLAQ